MKTLALAAALIAVVLAACSPPVTHGTVVDRRHTDAHEYSELYVVTQVCSIYGNRTVHVPERWELQLEAEGRRSWVDVDALVYEGCLLGRTCQAKG